MLTPPPSPRADGEETSSSASSTMSVGKERATDNNNLFKQRHQEMYGTADEWANDVFTDFRTTESEYDSLIEQGICIEDGFLECKKCGSKKILSFSRQIRSSD